MYNFIRGYNEFLMVLSLSYLLLLSISLISQLLEHGVDVEKSNLF